jgi:hypothetical protein
MRDLIHRLRRFTRRAAIFLTALGVTYGVPLMYPQPLFAYQVEHAGIILHARRPIPDAMKETLARVHARLERSPLYDRSQTFHVFICEPQWAFTLFARTNYQVGGIAHGYIGRHVFIRQSDMDHDRLIGPSGKPVAADRPLSYFIAHELTHILQARHLGLLGFWRLPRWVNDGYADYVARDIDLPAALASFKQGARELDPARSGLYLRYQLMVSFLLNVRGAALEELLNGRYDAAAIEQALRSLDAYPQ